MLHRNPPDRETQIPLYVFKSNQNLNLNLYHAIPGNLNFLTWEISGMWHFQWKLSRVPYVWHDLFVCVTWLIVGPCVLVASSSLIRVTWIIHMCSMTRSYAWHDSFLVRVCSSRFQHLHVIRLICMRDMTRSFVTHVWFVRAAWFFF